MRIGIFALCALLCFEAVADQGGLVEAEVRGKLISFAALESHYKIDVHGDVANVSVTQKFINPTNDPLNARYLFPLRRTAAVHAMTMHVGDEVISAEIKERQAAKKTFEAAKSAGKAASLLDQHRPNMFTQRIANLMPGEPITIEIEYSQTVPKVDGAYELVVPLVVGPRFQPPGSPKLEKQSEYSVSNTGVWALEALPKDAAYGGVHVPSTFTPDRVSLDLSLELPLPVLDVASATHELDFRHTSSTQIEAQFANGKVQDNRDLVITYRQQAQEASAGLLQHWEVDEGGYFSILIEPPNNVASSDGIAREMVFLLDCSGSMHGQPMAASKAFMLAALQTLKPTDTFRIIRFSDSATEFSSKPLYATPANLSRGEQYVRALGANGGTMMMSGINQALAKPVEAGRIRNVVFLTDGYIGNEISVLSLVEEQLQGARLFAYGVGAGVNRYLLDELGRVGRGFARYFDPTRSDETISRVAEELADRLHTPVLADIEIDWGSLPVTDIFPTLIPDLYAGDSLRVVGRFTEPSNGAVQVSGRTSQHLAKINLDVALEQQSDAPSLRKIWARSAVTDAMQEFIAPRQRRKDQLSDSALQDRVTNLGLTHSIMTRWTSFVAVSKKVYNANPKNAKDAEVAVPKVAGTQKSAYNNTMTGFAAPEPGLLLGMMTACLVLALKLRRRLARAFVRT